MIQNIALLVISFLAVVYAGCDNACSGHGVCGEDGVCQCYDNWGLGLAHYSGDCSQRTCPYEIAWVDTPDKLGNRHKYAECANRGICDRDSGECQCFPGYEGRGCGRTVCPNDCSGHGYCSYIENMPYKVVPQDYQRSEFIFQDPYTFGYFQWDKTKTRGCVCDPQYGDVDCSKRICPFATDIMDHRDDLTRAQKYQVQTLKFITDAKQSLEGQTFALTFKSRLNETFTTIPIVWTLKTGFHNMILDIEYALQGLPNNVIDNVVVQGKVDTAESGIGIGAATINITFTGNNVQGPQNLITVRSYECKDGCTPKISGLTLVPKSQNVTELQLSDFNSYECGRRGKCDYASGLCQCFAGYTGAACNVITSLV